MLEFALSQETARTAPLLPPEEGREENPVFLFDSATFSMKEQFPFPPGSQVHGTTVCDALLPHSRPQPILPAVKRVRFGDAVPPHAPLASPVWDPGSKIRLGYAIQFARRPPKFNGVLETSVAVRNAPVLREEIAVLLTSFRAGCGLRKALLRKARFPAFTAKDLKPSFTEG